MKQKVISLVTALLLPSVAFGQTIELIIGTDETVGPVYQSELKKTLIGKADGRISDLGGSEKIVWNEQFDGAYFGFRYSVGSVESNLVDMALGSTFWEPDRLALQNISYLAPFVIDDLSDLVTIIDELHDEIPAMQEAWNSIDSVFLTSVGVPGYHLVTTFPVNSVADLEGKKILAPGPLAHWAEGLGATPKNGVNATYRQQLTDGVAQGAILPLSVLVSEEIYTAAPHVTLVNFGAQVDRALSINIETWNELPVGVRGVIRDLAREFSALSTREILRQEDVLLNSLNELDVKIRILQPEERQTWADRMAQGKKIDRDSVQAQVLRAYLDKIRARGHEPLVDIGGM